MGRVSIAEKDTFFIQAGSNDGIVDDPLNKYIKEFCWKGICIEPIIENFKQLKTTHQHTLGVQLASFSKDQTVSDIVSADKYKIIAEEEVRSTSFKTLFNEIPVSKVDLLHIDVEDADWISLKSFCFEGFLSSFILCEHLRLKREDYFSSIKILEGERVLFAKGEHRPICIPVQLRLHF
jgi:hypothetical protein